ncbi:MAG: hypothetical protein LBC55_03610 [Desulfovibrio sp.]|jgi:hypothetical protein|nr:hypothetical protein [Desulfovibrio sp.]
MKSARCNQAGGSAGALFPPAPESVRRVLVCQLRQIGDVLLATPAAELLARHYPQAEIHMFTEKNACLSWRTIPTFTLSMSWTRTPCPRRCMNTCST